MRSLGGWGMGMSEKGNKGGEKGGEGGVGTFMEGLAGGMES